jgi:mannan endo-1,4-beta-mannosidase
VVRAWAFNDDPNKDDSGIQRDRLRYREGGLDGLDRVLERARAHGLKLMLALVNFWDAYGGARQWLRWNGVEDPAEGDIRFFTDGGARAHYAEHVATLLTRENRLTGIAYGEDPTVLAWELMNEPRGEPAIVGEWLTFAADCVRRHACQPISAGDEGALISPALDLASLHYYPEKHGAQPGAEAEDGCARIVDGCARARAAGQPLIVGEIGLRSAGPLLLAERRAIYRRWFAAAADAGASGIGPWLFTYATRPAEWDEFSFTADGTYDDVLLECAERLHATRST